MKKIMAIVLACAVFSAAFCGCVSPIQKIIKDSEPVSDSDELEDGEVYFQFSEDPEIEDQGYDNMSDEPSTCPLSQSSIDSIVKNAEDAIAQYPDFSGTILLSSGNRIIFEKSYGKTGVKNNENENSTIYQIGSVTKQFTGTAIMQLIKEGKINTAEPVLLRKHHDPRPVVSIVGALILCAGLRIGVHAVLLGSIHIHQHVGREIAVMFGHHDAVGVCGLHDVTGAGLAGTAGGVIIFRASYNIGDPGIHNSWSCGKGQGRERKKDRKNHEE